MKLIKHTNGIVDLRMSNMEAVLILETYIKVVKSMEIPTLTAIADIEEVTSEIERDINNLKEVLFEDLERWYEENR